MSENHASLPVEDLKNASSLALAEAVIELLLEKKGRNLTAYYVGEESAITDYYINITATSSTAVLALSDEVAEKMSLRGKRPHRVEGRSGASWVLVDFADVIVNVFDVQSREFYDLDRLLPADRKMDITPIKEKVDAKFNVKKI
ncbi:MAG: ribosome silencing factor [Clostridia bacterium]|nr:ribosome silencing factor [Clostridia bacterium]